MHTKHTSDVHPSSGGGRDPAAPNASADDDLAARKLELRLGAIEHKVLVLSGKGGVGKSTVATNLAVALARRGKRVGLLDVDIHGPSIPKMLGLEGRPVRGLGDDLLPVEAHGLEVMSIAFFLPRMDDAVIWRGPRKMHVIKQFLRDVVWGPLDFLVVDAPPGTGDEPLSVAQLIDHADGAVIVTTPQEVALTAVRRSITFCRRLELPVLGVVENMSGFVCPHCGELVEVFGAGGGERMAASMGVPFLGGIPLEPRIAGASDQGLPLVTALADTAAAQAFDAVVEPILSLSDPG